MFSQLFNSVNSRVGAEVAKGAGLRAGRDAELAPVQYAAQQSYAPFAQSFQQQQRPPVTDIYQRGAMPNDLLARYNSMAQMLQQQQAAMVPRTQPQMMPEGQEPWMGAKKPNPYTNFAQLFGGRNG